MMQAGVGQTPEHAMALRAARAAIGLSQVAFAERTGIPKTTIARFETLEGSITDDQFALMQGVLAEFGVVMHLNGDAPAQVEITGAAVDYAVKRLEDDRQRRADRGKVGVRKKKARGEDDAGEAGQVDETSAGGE